MGVIAATATIIWASSSRFAEPTDYEQQSLDGTSIEPRPNLDIMTSLETTKILTASKPLKSESPTDDCDFTCQWKRNFGEKDKVFGIGVHKTGTTTLGQALSILGYYHFGWTGDDRGTSVDLMHAWKVNNMTPLERITKEYDCFEDMPWPFVYEHFAAMYPSAKFVLTLRKDVDAWYHSLQEHIRLIGKKIAEQLVYGEHDVFDEPEYFKARYTDHNAGVRKFFASHPERLLEICWECGDSWSKLCDFLGEPIPDDEFPHSNHNNYVIGDHVNGYVHGEWHPGVIISKATDGTYGVNFTDFGETQGLRPLYDIVVVEGLNKSIPEINV